MYDIIYFMFYIKNVKYCDNKSCSEFDRFIKYLYLIYASLEVRPRPRQRMPIPAMPRFTGMPAEQEIMMEIREAQRILNTLAQGIHPTTGEVFAADSPYNEPKVIRALFTVHQFVRYSKKPKMTVDERRSENLDLGRPENHGLPWTEDDRSAVAAGFEKDNSVEELAASFGRTSGAIRSELIRQGLLPPDYE